MEKVTAALAGGVQFGHRLIEVDANVPNQPSGPDELPERLPQRGLPWTAPLRAADGTSCAAYAPLASPARSAAAPT